jgi:cellulose 1,4-beta-cellobiosidase
MASKYLILAALAGTALAQQIGKLTPEVHPSLPSWECTVKGGCVQKNTSVVLDSDYRWTHTVNGYDNCKTNGLNATLCPDAKTCSQNCALEGVDYGSYGIYTNGSELTLDLFVNKTTGMSLSSPRVYLLAENSSYAMFSMLDRELAFDVDLSKLPCGTNGALYFSEMSASGGQSDLNPAGAAYGTGYCDAQCPSPAFINGEVGKAPDTLSIRPKLM